VLQNVWKGERTGVSNQLSSAVNSLLTEAVCTVVALVQPTCDSSSGDAHFGMKLTLLQSASMLLTLPFSSILVILNRVELSLSRKRTTALQERLWRCLLLLSGVLAQDSSHPEALNIKGLQ